MTVATIAVTDVAHSRPRDVNHPPPIAMPRSNFERDAPSALALIVVNPQRNECAINL